tara:strand:+ start:2694 stop:3275 length:582 start_codon:yes stop_codon:yes gene_type:complete
LNFNNKQLKLLQDTSFFEEKSALLKAVETQMSLICDDLKLDYSEKSKKISSAPKKATAKITRGENLKGLPYLILDFPQHFSKTEIFSFRLLFWWGNGFTLFLHLKNSQLEGLKNLIVREKETLNNEAFYVSTNGDEWEHDYLAANYIKMGNFKADEPHNFIKFAFPISFNQSSDLKQIIIQKTNFLLSFLAKL